MDDLDDDALELELIDEAGDAFDQAGPGLFDEFDPDDEPVDEAAEPSLLSSPSLLSPPGPASPDAPESPDSAPSSATPDEAEDVTEPALAAAPEERPEIEPQLALYRRYRPDTFAEVIGQEHVTEPLQRALLNNKVNHAYLFSGPRGCGKTSSARILARCLNCEQGPTPTPCGVCQSCRDLATGGTGSIDVIEMDAASHGGVNEARDLRERAFFAPVHSRYKVYIIDEAHMVTREGFNALLKLVEEPPPHVKFIFATTEPEKVLGTIRSRTHHYPFRLVPPKTLASFLGQICAEEGVEVEQGVLPLVVRAGAGSVRDSLSVLDQLLGAAGEQGVSYEVAAGLLGYTPDSLLDDIVDAFAANDASGVFATIDKIIEVGQDPRRFAEDLLQRCRDLVIVAQVEGALSSGLIDVSSDQGERLTTQAAGIGPGELTRAAEVIAKGLTEMRGTTAPRLHLELMCARVLLPGADVDGRGIHARLDRLERRMAMSPLDEPDSEAPQPRRRPAATPTEPVIDSDEPPAKQRPRVGEQRVADNEAPAPARQRPAAQRPARPVAQPVEQPAAEAPPAPQQATAQPAPIAQAAATPAKASALNAVALRRVWPNVLERVKERRRFTWMLLGQNAQVSDVSDGVLTLAFTNAGARDSFASGGSADVLRDVLIDEVGADLRIVGILGGDEPVQQRSAARATEVAPEPPAFDDGVSADDEVFDDGGASAAELLTKQLGAQMIDTAED